MLIEGRTFIHGTACSRLLYSDLPLSFWGGVSATGVIVDHHHALRGSSLVGCIVAIPSGRGSCTGSGAILELLVSGKGPAGFIFRDNEDILTLGVLVARTIFNLSIPVVQLNNAKFTSLSDCSYVGIEGNHLWMDQELFKSRRRRSSMVAPLLNNIRLNKSDSETLEGKHGTARQMAMKILVEFATIQGAEEMIDVTQAHIDACIYIGPAGLQFAQHFASLGAKFAVPTTLNSISIDRRRWKELGLNKNAAQPAEDLAKAYMSMGAKLSFTCAPYLLDSAPRKGEQIGWAESNAVVFANSVLGARTQKYPDFLDVCVALTGRAPLFGCHQDQGRLPALLVDIPPLQKVDDSTFPLLGYLIGNISGSRIPFVSGLESTSPRVSDLKAFGAGFATSSSAPMFHIRGVTPESTGHEEASKSLPRVEVTYEEIVMCRESLNTAQDATVDLVSLGNPHFSLEEFINLTDLCNNRQKHPKVNVVVTTSRSVQQEAESLGYLKLLFEFGIDVITDTCWCMIDEPVIPKEARNLMTNSAKYAHYAPGMVRRGVHFGSLAQCVDAACAGQVNGAFRMR